MLYIAHRINTEEELKKVPKECGIEVDLRDRGDRLVLQHDPFKDGEDFEGFLKSYRHAHIILNIKSERIEDRVLDLLKKFNITEYFFLDSSFPMMVQLSRQGESNLAVRLSEYEGLDTVLAMKNKVQWVWVDCFSRFPLEIDDYETLKANGFQLCLVSPELQGRPDEIEKYKEHLKTTSIDFDAICTKVHNIGLWQK